MNVDLSWSRYNDIADEYERVMVPHFFQPVAVHFVSLLPLRRGQRVLDVACGTGIVGRAALERFDQLCVVGIDLSLPMMQHAKHCGIGRLAVANVLDLPFAARFDHVAASFVLNHLPDCVSAVGKMTQALRSHGTIGLTSWAIGPSENEVGTAWSEVAATYVSGERLRDASRRALPNEEYLHSRDALAAILRQAGLSIVRSEQVGFITNMTAADYSVSRFGSLSGRFIKSSVPPERWREFQATAINTLADRFGEKVEIRTAVNFAIAT
ncbi:MAG: methyltransferase domain-containing protein [Acidobacteriota bacterium]|nr:methyltransferase domain-containing protein [Acidobacteriota bacterium]